MNRSLMIAVRQEPKVVAINVAASRFCLRRKPGSSQEGANERSGTSVSVTAPPRILPSDDTHHECSDGMPAQRLSGSSWGLGWLCERLMGDGAGSCRPRKVGSLQFLELHRTSGLYPLQLRTYVVRSTVRRDSLGKLFDVRRRLEQKPAVSGCCVLVEQSNHYAAERSLRLRRLDHNNGRRDAGWK